MTTHLNVQDSFLKDREWMLKTQILRRGIKDPQVLKAISTVPRHLFVLDRDVYHAYEDNPLPIGCEQTISQPYIVAFMSEAIHPKPKDRVLEIGTGSGYQAAILSQICKEVYTVEIIEPLATQAIRILTQLKYTNVHVKVGDGYQGWPEASPFDAILITAASSTIPEPLIKQLKVGGKLVMPLKEDFSQENLVVIKKTKDGIEQETLIPVQFVPMTGKAHRERE